jgi:hypothetical protein
MFDEDNILKSPHEIAQNANTYEPLRLVLEGPARERVIKLRFWTILCAAFVIAAGLTLWLWGVPTQRHNPGFWQVSLVSVLFWVGITQGMMALSALIRVAHATWRFPLNRLLDMSSLFGLWGIVLIPYLVYARHEIYGLGVSDLQNNVWRVAGSTLWDNVAIGTAYLAGWILLYLTCLPDFAILRDRAPDDSKEKRFYRRLAGLWTGGEHQWRVLRRAEGVLIVGLIVAYVASQTVLGWDYQLAAAHDWDSSIFAPLFTLGSLLGGLAATVLVMTIVNRILRGRRFITAGHYDNIGKFMIALGLIWFYFRWCDYLTAWYGHVPDEWQLQNDRTHVFPVMVALMIFGCFLAPVFANFFRGFRRSAEWMCTLSVFVLLGLAAQRYLDTAPTFALKFTPSSLYPTVPGFIVFLGLAGMFVLTYLFFARYIPIMSWWGTSKERTRFAERNFGNSTVTVMVEDPPVWET